MTAAMLGSIALSETAKEITKPILRKLLDNGTKITTALKGDFTIEGQEVSFLCPENRQKWGLVFVSKKGLLDGKRSFPNPAIKRVSVESIMPYKNVTNDCLTYLEGGGFELHYKRLSPNIPYMLNVESEIENPQFMENLVYKKVLDDTPTKGKKKYWMEAQLKFTDVFEKMFSEVRLEQLDFDVRVSTHEDIDTTVPKAFKRELNVVVDWMNETDRNKKYILNKQHEHLLRTRRGGGKDSSQTLLRLIQDLQDIFMANSFKTFIDIQKDFFYHDSLRGLDYYSAPFPTWPKFMTVVTRTDLNLDKPAAHGYLEFNQQGFRDKVSDVFSKVK